MTVIQLRRGTAAQWASADPVLSSGEKGIETDTGIEKTGDGVTAWSELPPAMAASFAPAAGIAQSAVSGLVADLAQATVGVGSWVGNLDGYNLGKWRDNPPARLQAVMIGHSIAKGNTASTPYSNGFAPLVRKWLQRQAGDGGHGLYFLGRTEWTATAGWSNTGSYGPHGITRYVSDNATPTWSLTGVVGDNMDIFYLDVPLAGPITYTVDGGAAQTVAVAGAGDTATKKVNVSLGAMGTHTIVISGPASGKLYFMGVAVYKGTTGAVLHDWALSGATTASVAAPSSKLDALALIDPDLVLVMCMINDHYTQVPLATFAAQLNTIIDAAQATGADVLLLLEPDIQETFGITQRQYEAEVKSIAEAQGVPWASYADLWGDYTANTARMADTVHPNTLGHADMAVPLVRLLGSAWSDVAPIKADGALAVATPRTLGAGALQAAPGAHGHSHISQGQECLSRDLAAGAVAVVTGSLNLTYFTALRSEPITGLEYWTSTAAGATPTLIRYGLFVVADDGTLTLVASTVHDATLLAAANTLYPKAFSAGAYTWVQGQRYASGLLVVSGAALPSMVSNAVPTSNGIMRTIHARAPQVSAELTGQADLPATIAAGTQGGIRRVYVRAY